VNSPFAKRTLLTAVGLGASLALLGCSAASDPGSDAALTWGKSIEVVNFDPQASGNATDWELQNLVYEQLISLDDDLMPVPELATSWEKTSDTTYVFTLRDDIVFSNGRALTVDDVVGSLQRVMDPATGSGSAGSLGIASVTAVGEHQVSIELAVPNEVFLPTLATTAAAILPMEELQAGTFDPSKEFLGTGPYMVSDHVQGASWSLASNPEYWGPEPESSELEVRIIGDETARIAALRSGSVDFASFQTPDAPSLLQGIPGVTTVSQPTSDYYRLDVNAISSPFSDLRLRQALALAIDREELAETALGGNGDPAYTATPAGFPDSCSPAATPFVTQDLDAANALLTEAEAVGAPVTILAPTSGAANTSLAQILQQQLNAAGFDATIEQPEDGVWSEQVFGENPDFDMSLSWYAGGADAGGVLARWDPVKSQFNAGYVVDHPDLDAMIAEANSTSEDRASKLQAVCDRIATEANVIPLVTRNQTIAYNSDRIDVVLPKLAFAGDPFGAIAEYTVK
jgi:peptide/nickel transport system substrate-binding protein